MMGPLRPLPRVRRAPRAVALLAFVIAGCAPQTVAPPQPQEATPPTVTAPPRVEDRKADPGKAEPRKARIERGRVSHYGNDFAGRKTASGETFDPEALTMAHRTLPFGTRVRVTNVENKRSVELVVNDRGPFVEGRIADVSEAAARALGMVADGVVDAVVEVVAPATR